MSTHGPHGSSHSDSGSFTDGISWGSRNLNQQHSVSWGTTSIKSLPSDLKGSMELLKKAAKEVRDSLPIKNYNTELPIGEKVDSESIKNLLKNAEGKTNPIYKWGTVDFNVRDLMQERGRNPTRGKYKPHDKTHRFHYSNNKNTPQKNYRVDSGVTWSSKGKPWIDQPFSLINDASDYIYDSSVKNTPPDNVSGGLSPGTPVTKKNSTDILGLLNRRKFTSNINSFGQWNVSGTIHGNHGSSHSDCLRELKENISDFKECAIELINEINICNFNYKDDKEKLNHIGFIADDTPEEFTTYKKDRMDFTNCIGILLKSIQEIDERLRRLEEKNV